MCLDFSSAENVDDLDLIILDLVSEGEEWVIETQTTASESGLIQVALG